ncbi:MAG: 3-isopropylmalate dehydratase small subunit [Treponema sp.]|jgi:3-isopropylmalate/(R)-2-methylmalate dehydratase small subunit|nr:3-isopropylmalate dehydratase small subunit [Treponema sp.]
MIIKDKVFEVYPDNVSAELIAHTRHVSAVTPEGLSAACMKDVDPDFHKKMEKGKIMIAGNNFGCNSSREWAPAALLYSGVKLIIARSFSRIFYRSAINIGLPILECKEITDFVTGEDSLEVDLSTGSIINITSGRKTQGAVLPEFLLDIMTAGGLMEKLKTGAA